MCLSPSSLGNIEELEMGGGGGGRVILKRCVSRETSVLFKQNAEH
jgi:hypothetical protein